MYMSTLLVGNPTPVFLPGESHGQRSQAGYMGSQRVRHNCETNFPFHDIYDIGVIILFNLSVSSSDL